MLKDIRRQTRRHYSAEERISIVLEGRALIVCRAAARLDIVLHDRPAASGAIALNLTTLVGNLSTGAELGPVNYRPQFLGAIDITRVGVGS